MAKIEELNDADIREGDLFLNFYNALNDYFMDNGSSDELKCTLIDLSVSNAYNDATNQGAYNALFKKDNQTAKDNQKKSQEAMKDAINLISGRDNKNKGIDKLLGSTKISSFDLWHSGLCEELICIYKNKGLGDLFTYGNAQKWVNMTVKYLYIYSSMLGNMTEFSRGKNPLGGILNYKKFFHVPIDSYILRALFYKPGATSKKYENKDSIRKQINDNYHGELIKYCSEDDADINIVTGDGFFKTKKWNKKWAIKVDKDYVSWSNIASYKNYEKIQELVGEQIPSKFKSDPLAWENKVWIYASQIIK